jgi:SAM-dependent methyltransferase
MGEWCRGAAAPILTPVTKTCPACDGADLRPVIDLGRLPANGTRPFPTRAAALAEPAGRVRLVACGTCGFVFNAAFDPALVHVGPDLEETQAASPAFVRLQHDLAREMVARHGLAGGRILEIGCGKGEFLALLAETAGGSGEGFDPAFVPGRAGPGEARIRVHRRFFDAADAAAARADVVVCRMTLEHAADPARLVDLARDAATATGATVIFTVPEALHLLRAGNPFEAHHEHAGYFTPGSLARLFRRRGLTVTDIRILHGGQCLLVEARPGGTGGATLPVEEPPDATMDAAMGFAAAAARTIDRWRARIAGWRAAGGGVVLWGAGSRATTLVNLLQAGPEVSAVVDANPRRDGTFVAGTGHPVVAPHRLPTLRPRLAVVLNPVYRDEVGGMLAGVGLGSTAVETA